ncbi:dimethylallyltranstransferase [Aureococcus anophagefferens]|nr:dimethylallyltranstransferase [Aureococcus anophagefferens]
MSPIILAPVAAAWFAVLKDLDGDAQLKVAALAAVTLLLVVLKPGPKKASGAPTDALVAVDKARVPRRPYPAYDVSTAEAKKASFSQIMPMLVDEACDEVAAMYEPCWYKVDGVGPMALNDAFLIEMVMFKCDRCDLDKFTLDRWTMIVKYKTAFYSFYLPVAMGMTMAGIDDRAEYDAAREILVIMGVYFQAQDDYLDAFGTPEQIGKIGTDIQDKKCGWLFVNAYHGMVDAAGKKLLDGHYGKCKVGSKEEKKIKQLYKDIDLEQLYKDYEQKSYDDIMKLEGTCKQVPWAVFEIFLKKIFKRSK